MTTGIESSSAPPITRHLRWRVAAAAAVCFVAVVLGVQVFFGWGMVVYRFLPATWYFALIELKHGDPVAGEREEVPLSELERHERVWVVLVLGQSNAANSSPERTASQADGVFYFHRGRLTRARDPLPGSTADGGGPWPRVGDALVEAGAADAVVFAGASVGGSDIAKWEPGGKFHGVLLQRLRDLRAAGLEPTHVLWHQGEADTTKGTSEAAYKNSLQAIIKSLRAEKVEGAIVVAVASMDGSKTSPAIRAAQRSTADPPSCVFEGPDMDELGPEWRHDGLHWNAEGVKEVADRWVEILTQLPPCWKRSASQP